MVQRDSMPEIVARQIADLARAQAPGARLGSKADLLAQVGVSEGTLNTTLRLLQTQGVIRLRSGPGGGVFVAEQTPIAKLGHAVLELSSTDVDVSAAVQVRNGLEYEIVADACVHRTEADLAEIDGLLASMRRAFDREDEDGFVRLNWALHRRLAELTPNELLRSLYVGLLDTIESSTVRVVADETGSLHAFHAKRMSVHDDLGDVIRRGDAAGSVAVVLAHNRGIRESDVDAVSHARTDAGQVARSG